MFILARLHSPSLSHTSLRSSRHTHTQRPPHPSDIRRAMSWASLQPLARPTPKRCSLASCELSRVSDCLAMTLGAPSHSPISRELAVLISGHDQYLKPSRSDAIATCCSESFVHASCLQQGSGRPRLGPLSHRDRPLAQPYTKVIADGRELYFRPFMVTMRLSFRVGRGRTSCWLRVHVVPISSTSRHPGVWDGIDCVL